VRADTAISGLTKIAVVAKDLKPIRKPILDKPGIQPTTQAFSVDRPIAFDVVHRQENWFGFSAARASRPVVFDHGANMLRAVLLVTLIQNPPLVLRPLT
jgi:hypothetical protein